MGPKLAGVTAQPPRNVPPQRAETGQGDAPARDTFGSLLEEQGGPALPASPVAEQPGMPRPPLPLNAGLKIDVAPGMALKTDMKAAAPTARADAGWQALLAQVLSGETGKIELPPSGDAPPSLAAGDVAPAVPEMLPLEAAADAAPSSEDAPLPAAAPVEMPALPPQAAEAAVAALLAAPGQTGQAPVRKDAPPTKGEATPGRGEPAAKSSASAAIKGPDALPDDGVAAGVPALPVDAASSEDGGKPLDGFSRQMLARATEGESVEETRSVAVRNVNTTTHYPLVNEPMRQIAGQVVREVQVATAPPAAALQKPTTHDVSKTMDIQLEPESLGAVNVKMKLTGGSLTIQIEVAKPETLEMIKRSQDVLHRSLQSENCQLDGLTIRAASAADAGGLSQNGQSAQQQSGQSNPNGATSNASAQQQDASSHAGDRSRGQRGQERSSGKSEYDETVTPRDRASVASGLYL